MIETNELADLLQRAKAIAQRYRELTGRPLGITGEIAEAEVVRLLGYELAPVRCPGYDVVRPLPDGTLQRLQVKGRVLATSKYQGRVGAIDIRHEWDWVLLVLMDRNFDTFAIFEAPRARVIEAIQRPGSKSRNERGALAIPQFCSRSMSVRVWPPPP
jgi:hypothetical protein